MTSTVTTTEPNFQRADLEIRSEPGLTYIKVIGSAVISTVERFGQKITSTALERSVVFDLSTSDRIDTAGALMIVHLQDRIVSDGGDMQVIGCSETQAELIETVKNSIPPEELKKTKVFGLGDAFETIGQSTFDSFKNTLNLLSFFGLVISNFAQVLLHPRRFRATSVVHHMQEIGYNAIPIVSLMAFLIGVVLAFQGAAQLRQFGAEVFVVDLIAISILRELGILLTAIIVAGRTGSAFTAAIGSMKMREEIDAMRTLGLDPIEVLVIPRVLALVLMLPVLGFIADMMGLIGGSLLSWFELGVSPGMFVTRLYETVDVWHYVVGLVKAPVFAVIIGIIGCYEGLRVGGDAESLGRRTSRSVVLSIFTVIVADAMFSIFFAIVDV